MYNLFISGNADAWDGTPWVIERSRCVTEYTDDDIKIKYGDLSHDQMQELKRLPCIFGFESSCKKNPRFGVIRDFLTRSGESRIDYELISIDPFLTAQQMADLSFELDIGKWELNRTHWAVKSVNLAKELHSQGIVLPHWARAAGKSVDITKHQFAVALSFPGECRTYMEAVAAELERLLGPNSYFYDNNYVSQLARPSLDVLLQKIYGDQSALVVVFLGEDYQNKKWCGVEFRVIREIIMKRQHERVMFVRMDDGKVDGVFDTDGYVDARKYPPADVARFIQERAELVT